ncbi:MAG: hypothetical protein AB7Q69_18170 [Gemmatimonadales bacterium]
MPLPALGRAGLLLLGGLAVPAGIAAWRPLAPELPPASPAQAAPAAPGLQRSVVDSMAALVARRDPFRMERAPAPVAFSAIPPEDAAPAPAPPPKPNLVLSGLVWSARPEAVIEGFPGVEGPRVVRPGDVIGAFRIRRITRKEVTVTGMDTTWVLRVREPW